MAIITEGSRSLGGGRLRVWQVERRLPAADNGFGRQLLLVLASFVLFNGSNYLLHAVLSRMLGPGSYGGLAALLAVLLVASVPVGVVQAVVAKRTAVLRGAGRTEEATALAAGTLKTLVVVGAVASLAVAATAPALGEFLGVGLGASVLLAPYVVLTLLLGVLLGLLQGRLEFGRLSFALLSGVAARLGLAIVLVAAGWGIVGAMVATVVAQAVSLLVALGAVGGHRPSWRRAPWTLKLFSREELVGPLLGLGGFWLLAQLDVVLARHALPSAEAGRYAAAALFARAILIVPAAVSLAALPRFADDRRRVAALGWLRRSLRSVVLLTAASSALVVLAGRPLLVLAFGGRFGGGSSALPLLTAGAALLAVVNLLVYFHIGVGSRAHWFLFVGLGLELVLLGVVRPGPTAFAAVVLVSTAVVAALQLHAAAMMGRASEPLLERRLAVPRAPSGPPVEISVVLPCHNGAVALPAVLETLTAELEAVESFEVIVVSDGSTDDTVSAAEAFAGRGVRVLHYPQQAGKGHALGVGLSAARGNYVAFLDADGDIHPQSLRSYLELMRLFEPDVVLASKRHPLSEVSYPPLRRVLSWGYHQLTRLLFRINVRDTQTGCKLIRRDVLEDVLPRMHERRFAFDLEFLVIAQRLGFTRLLEAPVRIDYRFASHVNPAAVRRIFFDTLAIWYRCYVLNAYPPVLSARRRSDVAARVAYRRRRADGKLRVAVFNWRDVQNPEAGGAEAYTHEVATRWAAAGHEVTVFASRFAGSKRSETVDGVRILRSGALRSGVFYLRAQRRLARLSGFDAVIDEINVVPFLTPLWRRRLPPVVALVHQLAVDVWDAELPGPLASVGRRLEPRLLSLYRDVPIVTVSASSRGDLRSLGMTDVTVVHGGRDLPPQLDCAKELQPTFLYAGRLAANKRPDHALEAFETIRLQIPEARLWIAGRGPLEAELARRLPPGADLLGYLPRAELYERMARAHCLLVPSVREGWGLVVIEAASVGTPAAGYDVHGIRDSIRNGVTGVLAAAGDPADLGRRAAGLVADPGYADTCTRAADWAAGFSWDETAACLLDTIERACAQPAPPTESASAGLPPLARVAGVGD